MVILKSYLLYGEEKNIKDLCYVIYIQLKTFQTLKLAYSSKSDEYFSNKNYDFLFLEYTNDQTLIPKNTSLIVSRIPLTTQQKKAWYVYFIVIYYKQNSSYTFLKVASNSYNINACFKFKHNNFLFIILF